MRKERDAPCELPLDNVVLMQVPWGFAFFHVNSDIFRMPVNMIWAHFTNLEAAGSAASFIDLVKFSDKSALWSSKSALWCRDGSGESFVDLVKKYSSSTKRFIVEDEKIRPLIKSNVGIDSSKEKEDVLREVAWGLRSAMPFLIFESLFDVTISPRCHLPLCQGFKVLMKKYQIVIPTEEAVDRDFLTWAGILQRVEEARLCRCITMRKACAKLVPGIGGIIKDNSGYVEVMAKILTPWLVDEEWNSSKWTTAGWFTSDEMQKIVAIDAAAGDAREKVKGDTKLAALIKANLHDYRCLSKYEDTYLQKLRSYEAKAKRGQKRSHTEMTEQEVVEGANGKKGEDDADVTEEK